MLAIAGKLRQRRIVFLFDPISSDRWRRSVLKISHTRYPANAACCWHKKLKCSIVRLDGHPRDQRNIRRGWHMRPSSLAALLFSSLPLETPSEHSAKSKRMMCPIGLGRGRRCHLFNTPAQPKHDANARPVGFWFLTELLFQTSLEFLCIGFLVFSCGWVREHGSKTTQFPVNSRSRPCTLAYWHLPHPVAETIA